MRKCNDYGIVFWLRFAEWCHAHERALTQLQSGEAAAMIKARFDISRATSYRWLAAWREARPTTHGAVPRRSEAAATSSQVTA